MSDDKHEIVIIRRGGHGDHDDHHGGVWKIAFADFMTAMMAFFLVMWLISANDKTRASVARYFNPVKLVDATTQPRGLHDPKQDESGVTASANSKEKAATPEKGKPLPPRIRRRASSGWTRRSPKTPTPRSPRSPPSRAPARRRHNPPGRTPPTRWAAAAASSSVIRSRRRRRRSSRTTRRSPR